MSYLIDLDTRIGGIPCIVRVTHYERVAGSFSHNAPSDVDYYGYTDSDWDVLDRRGRKADWLAKKLTADDVQRIESEIARAFE